MVFSSLTFVCLFLPMTALAYFLSPKVCRNLLLVIASMIFYAWSIPLALLLVLALVAGNFILGRIIDQRSERVRRNAIFVGIALNLIVLIFFKYADFLLANVNAVLRHLSDWQVPLPHIALPLGISFITFHIISYLVDVYRGSVRSQGSLTAFALYIIDFPQLIAGPIIRYHQIADQLSLRKIGFADIDTGVARFTLGLSKKLLVANPIGAVVDRIFMVSPEQLGSGTAWLGMLCYGLQIYFDFSGYSDMAIGIARIFGFRFPENFNYPYVAASVQDFWRRWHMTLSFWFRDYVYIPLGGNRHGTWNTARNLWIVFFLAGAWHGASWNFIVWGLWHGLFLWLERIGPIEATLARIPRVARHGYTMLVVFIGWVFFRAPDLTYALEFLGRMVGLSEASGRLVVTIGVSTPMAVLIAIACVLSLPLWPKLRVLSGHMLVNSAGAVRAPFPSRVTPHVFREFDNWFVDRIGLRRLLVSTGAALHVGLLRRSTDRRVVIGRDGWLFYTDDDHKPAIMADIRGALRFTRAQIRTTERNLTAMRETFAACGVRGLVVVAPNAQSIYGEYLFDSSIKPVTRLDDLLAHLSASTRGMILDLRAPLIAVKTAHPEQPLYFKTDSHWNDLGAFYAYRAIVGALAKTGSIANVSLTIPENYALEETPYDDGDLAINMLSSPGRFQDVQILLHLKAKAATAQSHNGQLLFIGDSFSDRLGPFLERNFAESRFVGFSALPVAPARVEGPQPTVVVLEVVERYLTSMTEWDFDWRQFCPR